jgi:class 3 adenylate cyclase
MASAVSTQSAVTTILFTDLVGSTELMQRVGDESAQELLGEHHRLLAEAVEATGGAELQWMGDGLMAAFGSTADAVRCAMAMQRAARQQVGGQRLKIRVGLNAGETLQQEAGSGHFGTPVVIAKRLCDRADSGQILCSHTIAGLLTGRAAFSFRDLGATELKGIATPVGISEVLCATDGTGPILRQNPFVARAAELARLSEALERVRGGRGELLMVVGEPGIGKTRLLEEFARKAEESGALVLSGASYEGDRDPPFCSFAEAIAGYAQDAEREALEKDLGPHAASVAKIAPVLRERIPDMPALPAVAPDEERDRLFDAVAQLLFALARRAPVVLVLDDLHWADNGTIALLRHVARYLSRHPILVIGAYRDVELDREHALADALGALRREAEYERLRLDGMGAGDVGALLQALAQQEVPRALTEAVHRETSGNPFFVREVILHLVEEGKLYHAEGRWRSDFSVEELGIPEGIRQVVGRRLSRLPEEANQLLAAASGFNGAFRFDVAAAASGLGEAEALDALDAALEAQLLRPAGAVEEYDFSHALIRHTLYRELNPSRQVRLHRRIAEEMERFHGYRAPGAGPIAEQYHRSAALPGAERGVVHCLAAADAAAEAASQEEAVGFLRMALDLLPEEDPRRPRVLARLGISLALTYENEEAAEVAIDAGARIAASEGEDAAADYLADGATAIWTTSWNPAAWRVASEGMRYIGDRRDLTWARLRGLDLTRRDAEDPDFAGMPPDSPERREHWEVMRQFLGSEELDLDRAVHGEYGGPESTTFFDSRQQILDHYDHILPIAAFQAGLYRDMLDQMRAIADDGLRTGQFTWAAMGHVILARTQVALGEFEASRETFAGAVAIADRMRPIPHLAAQMSVYPIDYAIATGDGIEAFFHDSQLEAAERPENVWARGIFYVVGALVNAFRRHRERCLELLERTLPAIESGGPWNLNYTMFICMASRALWEIECDEHVDLIERNLREKIVTPDFRYSLWDSRLSMGWLCALTGRHDEASEWFAKARPVLEEEGARPLRALVDYDEARMFLRRGAPGDAARARDLLAVALDQFRAIGMTGWIARAKPIEAGVAGRA